MVSKSRLHFLLLLLFIIHLVQMCIIVVAISKEEFNAAVTINGYSLPRDEVYRCFAKHTANFSREELAMFIAQLIHESGGFKHTEQLECKKGNHCAGQYVDSVGLPGKNYYGRGYIQLTWGANYKVASEGLGLGDRLLKHPEIVGNNTRIAMLVSVWYWGARVKPLLRGRDNLFGLTTKGINPGECIFRGNPIACHRYRIYSRVADALNISTKAKENGCYN